MPSKLAPIEANGTWDSSGSSVEVDSVVVAVELPSSSRSALVSLVGTGANDTEGVRRIGVVGAAAALVAPMESSSATAVVASLPPTPSASVLVVLERDSALPISAAAACFLDDWKENWPSIPQSGSSIQGGA